MSKAFTLVELLIVIAIIAILVGMAIIAYHQYLPKAIRASLLSDLRNCISELVIAKQENPNASLPQVVARCPKSKYTQSLTLESVSPIKLTATSISGEVSCSYNETSGAISCIDI
ncbi:prepilin-type N-terminal cleavage/methylation domain-containing protein [Thermodesulfobacterium sp. TA1]|uniref:prepilin-type N-terminal cleavage/methylation domain-containing protein n=1 Tax=Thermodesulfobacterium sp. TA1 TaxID=2234087 RepID=UPI001232C6A8|nr:prepilin-type N-terminal cleavage/methylation domain-containing protein [Thermodesulfobacterium sp. TA1]QER41707.1 prepilin-type N-terminal cleavage/methylation domain-containing protein [Thermodesulfobacterium sp. TA1]